MFAYGPSARHLRPFAALALVCGSAATTSIGGQIDETYPAPTLDRWNYVFAGFGPFIAGEEPDATVFSPFGNPQAFLFDNRDGEMIVGFDTTPAVPAGMGVTHYRVVSASVTLTTSRDLTFQYDPTRDPVASYFAASDPEFVADADAGRPIEMHLVGYRNGWDVSSYTETTPFSPAAPGTLPAKGTKNIHAAQYDPPGVGAIREVSNHVDQRFENRPLSVGSAPLTPGASVAAGTPFTFALDLASNPDAQRYLREGLNAGRLNFSITSLATVGQQSSIVPAFWCREGDTLLGAIPGTLSISVCVGRPSDFNCDGMVDLADLIGFISEWQPAVGSNSSGPADSVGDGSIDLADLVDFLTIWLPDVGT